MNTNRRTFFKLIGAGIVGLLLPPSLSQAKIPSVGVPQNGDLTLVKLRESQQILENKAQEFLHNPWIIHNNKLVTADGDRITIYGRDHPITQYAIECHKAICAKRDQIIIDALTKP